MQLLPLLTLVLRVFIGGYFLFAAVPKIVEPLAFATSISHYEMMPNFIINGFALVIPWLELLVGAALVVGFRIRTNAVITGALTLMFTVGVAWAVANGLKIDCGCFGADGGEEVSWIKVAKNMGLIAACAIMVWKPESWLSLDQLRRRSDA